MVDFSIDSFWDVWSVVKLIGEGVDHADIFEGVDEVVFWLAFDDFVFLQNIIRQLLFWFQFQLLLNLLYLLIMINLLIFVLDQIFQKFIV